MKRTSLKKPAAAAEAADFAKQLFALAEKAGAIFRDDAIGKEFVLQTPIGELVGGILFERWVWMRFTNPGVAKPGVAGGDFNPHSHKWNIQGYEDTKATLSEFEKRMAWATSSQLAA